MLVTLITALLLNLAFWAVSLPVQAEEEVRQYDVGILALRGPEQTFRNWHPTLDWLETQIPNTQFNMHTFGFDELEQAFLDNKLDFILTSPGQATALARQFPITSLATLKTAFSDLDNRSIASVVVVHKESGLYTLKDLDGKRMEAVDEKAFGGFLAFRYEVDIQNAFSNSYFDNITFTGPPTDEIIWRVKNQQLAVGIVPACTLENMIREKRIDANQLRVINGHRPFNSICTVSTPLYPNWSWSQTSRADNKIGKQLTQALLAMPDEHPAARLNYSIGWTSPVSNVMVDRVYQHLDLHPLQKNWRQRLLELVQRNKYLAGFALFSFATLVLYHFLLAYRFNRSRKALEHSIYELKEKDAMLEKVQRTMIVNELGSSMAHEINQPLSSIKNYARGLQNHVNNGMPSSQLMPYLERIEQQATVASDIVQRLRNIIKKHETTRLCCDPQTFIDESIQLLSYDFQKSDIQINCSASGQPFNGYFDYVGMQQVMLNLLRNAKEACLQVRDSRDILLISVELEYHPEQLIIRVIDNGEGLQAPDKKIQQAFFTTKQEGLGLGLMICREVIESQHGTLELRDSDAVGCTATITIPKRGYNS